MKTLLSASLLTLLASAAVAQERPADIVSPLTDGTLANTVSPEEAQAAGDFVYEPPTPENSIMLFIDHQIGLMAGVRDF